MTGRPQQSAIAVIPARFASSRFPGKPLALIDGVPMIAHVIRQVQQVRGFDAVVVATDHPDIIACAKENGAEAQMTDSNLPTGTDRVWAASQPYPEAQWIFNVQGDEPLVNPLYLEEALNFLKFHHDRVDMVTMKAPLLTRDAFEDANVVKVVTNSEGRALYFSRAPIPYPRDKEAALRIAGDVTSQHIGVYGYTRSALSRFVTLSPSRLEQIECLEQLRALEDGMHIHVLPVATATRGVDTPEDIARVEAELARIAHNNNTPILEDSACSI